MLKRNNAQQVFIVNGMMALIIYLTLSAQAQTHLKREADYLKLRRAATRNLESDQTTNQSAAERAQDSSARRQITSRRLFGAHKSEDDKRPYYMKNDKVAGRTISDYSGDFMQFLFSRPFDPSFIERDKENKGIENQHGTVWFLTPTADNEIEREVIIPKNAAMFFSLGWAFGFLEDYEPDENILGLQGFLSIAPDYFSDFEVSLDHEPLPREAIIATQSPITYFPLLTETAKAFGLGSMSRVYSRAAIGGNFVMLKPFSEGTHVLKIRFKDAEGNNYYREYYICIL